MIRIKIFIVLVVLSFGLIIFDRIGLLRSTRGVADNFLIPIQRSIYQKKIEKISRLEEENRKLLGLVNQLERCGKENNDMRRLLNAPLPSNWKFIPARIIGFDEGELLIDKGSEDKLETTTIAVYDNIYVGRIVRLGENFSKIATVFSPNVKILVAVKNPVESDYTARGLLTSYNGKIRLQKVLLEEKIQRGDLILTSLEGGMPPDLPIGKITKINKKDSDIFQEAEVEPLISYQNIDNVFLINFR